MEILSKLYTKLKVNILLFVKVTIIGLILANYKRYQSSPDIVKDMHQVVKRLTGISDPYKAVKERDIKAAKEASPLLREFVRNKQGKLYWALKTAATGNIIDSAIYNSLNFTDCLENELAKEFSVCDLNIFEEELKSAKSILIIGITREKLSLIAH